MGFLIRLLINALLVYVVAYLLSGVTVDGYFQAIIVALLLSVVNLLVKPIITILTLPITILTLGLFLLIINGAMVLLVDFLVPGFQVNGMFWAIIFAILLAVLNFFVGGYADGKE
jgi:putative membrane protein